MPKHNNLIPNQHFHKAWQNHVKTWFNQPAKKKSRRVARAAKAAAIFPRPVQGPLRPVVHCPTIKYNTKLRLGRGFTLEELRGAGITKRFAQTIGISVDHRRKNKSEGPLADNINRLKQYKAQLVLWPKRKESKKHPRKADEAAPEDREKATQLTGAVLPVKQKEVRVKAQVVEPMGKGSAFVTLRRARADAKYIGIRKKKALAREEKAKLKKKD
ncbi:ribosomal protein L13e, putative [Acanthamoeba castellanii str. Neff]|uniref:60S ribosomal protein L13 n=1 Tax=Acanthamoeba castellanii (strain ATCC 30010 / Neff) TaxID=1257118 RepID=L8GVI2_ACACF|nr:ribosomal protein L13e, putative [Acanthamoeba castellanii str. Neff]ELR17239.1 ribosomal protein L13e, putative [Acanthamoeba castellanii str. Neff]